MVNGCSYNSSQIDVDGSFCRAQVGCDKVKNTVKRFT